MKALDKSRSRRYETANALAADLSRYLDGDPIEARPPSTAYRLRKLASRHCAAFLATTAVLLTLVAGIVASTYFAALMYRERRQQPEKALGRLKVLLIDRAFMFAMNGDVDGTKLITSDDQIMDIGSDWQQILLGYAYWHCGERETAIEYFAKAREIAPDSYATHAVYTFGQIARGYDQFLVEWENLKAIEPTSQEDYLFKANACLWIYPDEALESLNHIGEWEDTAYGRATRALALAHVARAHSDASKAREASREVEKWEGRELNQHSYLLGCKLHVLSINLLITPIDERNHAAELLTQARAVSAQLQQYNNQLDAGRARALFSFQFRRTRRGNR